VGFSPVDEEVAQAFSLQRRQIQLYAEVIKTGERGPHDLRGRAVLEVAAGPGGGLLYISHVTSPRLLVGIDTSFTATRQGRRRGLDLRRGFAERLPFADKTFDYVLCVDSINLVTDPWRTFSEMERVLAPNGTILTGDFMLGRIKGARARLERWASAARLNVAVFRDVTANVQRAIKEDQPRNLETLAALPKLVRRFAVEPLTLKGSRRYKRWQSGAYCYYLAALTRRGAN